MSPWTEEDLVAFREAEEIDRANGITSPEGGDVMFYGDGGAGKSTLAFDLACHLAAGAPWLGIPVPRPVRVLLIENKGPRALLRAKLRRKVGAWPGPALDGRISVLEAPWGQFTFATGEWRDTLATTVMDREVDLVIAGPLTWIGMDAAGTLQEVNAFLRFAAEVRAGCGRRLTIALVHHENKGGAVSGAWEGAGDTLLHVQGAGNGHTVVVVQKARWASGWHGKSLKLGWTDGEGFELDGSSEERDDGERLVVGEYLGVGQAGAVIDRDVDVFPPGGLAALSCGVESGRARAPVRHAGDARSGAPLDPTQPLDIDVDQLARASSFVTLGWFQADPSELAHPDPGKDPRPTRSGDSRRSDGGRGWVWRRCSAR